MAGRLPLQLQAPRLPLPAAPAAAAAAAAAATAAATVPGAMPDAAATGRQRRAMCGRCTRPARVCVCSSLGAAQQIATSVIILQHPREAACAACCSVSVCRAVLARSCCEVIVAKKFPAGVSAALDAALAPPSCRTVGEGAQMMAAAAAEDSEPRTLLLYPGKGSVAVEALLPFSAAPVAPAAAEAAWGRGGQSLVAMCCSALGGSDAPPCAAAAAADNAGAGGRRRQRPYTLILVDGTWGQARAMVNSNPRLLEATLPSGGGGRPAVRLVHISGLLEAGSEFGFRKEPRRGFVSTLEALCAALASLEPEGSGGDARTAQWLRRPHPPPPADNALHIHVYTVCT
eukprot:SAG11_NODE_5717_length_1480_cov_3.475742_2_plen_344_part_00